MSLLKSLGRLVGGVARAAAPLVGTMNPMAGAVAGAIGQLGARSSALPGVGGAGPAMALPALGPVVVAGGRLAVAGARAAMRGAIAWCRRNPAWCSTVGGTAAVAAMIESGQLPMPRKRRGRGLSSRDLRGFRKTTRLIRQVAGSVGIRRGRGRAGGIGAGHTIVQN